MKLIELDEKDVSEQPTIHVAVPSVSGYMQPQYEDRLIVLLAALCDKTPEQFVQDCEASHE